MNTEIQTIRDAVVTATGIEWAAISSRSRVREIVFARQLFQTVVRERNNRSLTGVGLLFTPAYDHSSVLHNIQTVSDLCETDKNCRYTYELIHQLCDNFDSAVDRVDPNSASCLTLEHNLELI